jgi:uncharacterized protein DUF1360
VSTAPASVRIYPSHGRVDPDRSDAPERRADDPHRRSPAYAALAAGYGGLVGGVVVAARRRGKNAPRLTAGDIALVGVATFKLSRILSRDRVTSFLRAPFTRFKKPGKTTEILEEPVGTGVQRAVGELVSCPFCISQWIGTAFVGGYVFSPSAARLVASGLTAITVSDLLQYGHTALQERAG